MEDEKPFMLLDLGDQLRRDNTERDHMTLGREGFPPAFV